MRWVKRTFRAYLALVPQFDLCILRGAEEELGSEWGRPHPHHLAQMPVIALHVMLRKGGVAAVYAEIVRCYQIATPLRRAEVKGQRASVAREWNIPHGLALGPLQDHQIAVLQALQRGNRVMTSEANPQ